jgi:hypothetical protein
VRWGTQQLASSPARTDLCTGEGGTERLEVLQSSPLVVRANPLIPAPGPKRSTTRERDVLFSRALDHHPGHCRVAVQKVPVARSTHVVRRC